MRTSKRAGGFARHLGLLVLALLGWRIEGQLPSIDKAVVVAAPHTSNWDMPIMLAVAYALGIRPTWLGKRELFAWPFGGLMRWLGGIAVDRGRSSNLVADVVDVFGHAEVMMLVIPPAGTRARVDHWKSGFYHIARAARVPVLCSFLDYERRVGGIGHFFAPSGDVATDMAAVREFYSTVQPCYPGVEATPRLLEEDQAAVAL